MSLKLSLRVYGICFEAGKVLLLEERIQGNKVLKFPGGGLELGEGPRACLIREIQEELFIQANPKPQPIYVTPDFIRSQFLPNHQIVLMYYLVPFPSISEQTKGAQAIRTTAPEIENHYWLDANEAINRLTLESDRQAIQQFLILTGI